MTKRKGTIRQTMRYKILHTQKKQKIEYNEPHKKTGVNSNVAEGQ